ncbi:hypothetical protein C5167_014391 [Papaver somniferum]|uniref:RING-type E3 ubiquitin transferase n=1 Tax=Papaver somniferum TaxID=3469 RepID=A0A4Y7J329_PAPSO|nr:E3 ubiquitin-protein ligase Topors-like [Papaver somniferum]RZC55534.1 hypothetical protein C5167_014391 [Papaver somniferum]
MGRRNSSSTSKVSSITKRVFNAIRDKSCPICLQNFDNLHHHYHQVAVLTFCMHAYCIHCIHKWSHMKRNCPLCNAEFDSWFSNFRVFTGKFEVFRLPKLDNKKMIDSGDHTRQTTHFLDTRMVLRRRHREYNRSRPYPLRRVFMESGLDSLSERQRNQVEIVTGSVLQWRASIYNKGIQAIPLPSRSCQQNVLRNNGVKEIKRRRIEPWIIRELQSVLGDSDPSVIVHLATSLYISGLEEKQKNPSNNLADGDSFIEPLKPFLREYTKLFWHELRCYDESSLTIEVYDTVVDYRRST